MTVSASPSHGDSALDYDSLSGGVCRISGGTVAACGFYGKAECFESRSEQCSLMLSFADTAPGGARTALLDADGTELAAYTPAQDYNCVIFSGEALRPGEKYTVLVGERRWNVTPSGSVTLCGDVPESELRGLAGAQ